LEHSFVWWCKLDASERRSEMAGRINISTNMHT
jgi:hypothetical protein